MTDDRNRIPRRGQVSKQPAPRQVYETPRYIAARVAMEELLEAIEQATADDLETLTFIAKDSSLIESCIRIQLRAERELGRLLTP